MVWSANTCCSLIDLETRRVQIAGIVHDPHEAWMKQVARNLGAVDGFLLGKHYLIMDRDPMFTRAFRLMLAFQRQLRDDRTRSAPQAHRRIAQLLLSKRCMKA